MHRYQDGVQNTRRKMENSSTEQDNLILMRKCKTHDAVGFKVIGALVKIWENLFLFSLVYLPYLKYCRVQYFGRSVAIMCVC